MATKAKSNQKSESAPKKTAAAPLISKPTMTVADFTKGFSQFPQFQQLPKFTPISMENPMIKGNKQFDKLAQDAAASGQEQMDAFMKSCTIWGKGIEEMMQTCIEMAQTAGEKSQAAAKSMMSCKTLNEYTDAQTKLAQASFDEFMTNVTKISEKGVKLCTDAMEPINDQMGKAIKKASSSMAA